MNSNLGPRQIDLLKALYKREPAPRYLTPAAYGRVADSLVKLNMVERSGTSAAVALTDAGTFAMRTAICRQMGEASVVYRAPDSSFTSFAVTVRSTNRHLIAKAAESLRADGVEQVWVENNGVRQSVGEYLDQTERLDKEWGLGLPKVLTGEQAYLRRQAIALRDLLDDTVPSTTIHWAVEDLRKALDALVGLVHGVKTNDTKAS